jgi:hypothetical protein
LLSPVVAQQRFQGAPDKYQEFLRIILQASDQLPRTAVAAADATGSDASPTDVKEVSTIPSVVVREGGEYHTMSTIP